MKYLHGSDTALCPPSLRRYDRGEFDHEAKQHERAGLHRARRGRSFPSELAYAGPHARTHAGWWWWCWWSPRFLPRPQARRVCDVGLTEVNAARSRAFDEPPPLCLSTQKPPISSVRSIDKTMDHGQESTGSPPTSLPSQGPGRRGSPPRFVSWPSWSSRRPSDRAFRSASRSASPHIHAHAG